MRLVNPYPYSTVLSETLLLAEARIPGLLGCPAFSLSRIDDATLQGWNEQWRPHMPQGQAWSDWDWREEMSCWRGRKVRRRFDAAIWSGQRRLCGLVVGLPSRRRSNLTIRALQGCPLADHPLKGNILAIVDELADMYGTALGCRELRFWKPLQGMVPTYQRMDYELVLRKGIPLYCRRPLPRDSG
jgi:hypothetical protein